ncbi:MAG: hypothetical protein IPJ61_21115 [Tessaracoccus sp.]|uniref:hypothetical protein n=1 Tax=Tessaracoccus sp. TaxID=1971211 RepID=UPI001ED78D3F|nr:hypothetical protein [Tessaracoccus sp.]MBK7823490.1 hypothetical protein [Tessaracoccus sp.]
MLSTRGFSESDVEESALAWATGLGFDYQPGPTIAPGEFSRSGGTGQVVLEERFGRRSRGQPGPSWRSPLGGLPQLLLAEGANLVGRNRAVHRMLVDGVNVEYARKDGSIAGAEAW